MKFELSGNPTVREGKWYYSSYVEALGNGTERCCRDGGSMSGGDGQSRIERRTAWRASAGTGDVAVAAGGWRRGGWGASLVEVPASRLGEVHRAQEIFEGRAAAQGVPQRRNFEEDERPVALAETFLKLLDS